MAQSFTPGYPPTGSTADSLTERGNWAAVLSSHAGASLPGYAVEGMPWFDTTTRHLHVAKTYGSKAFGAYLLGTSLRLAISLTGAGQDGNTYGVNVRVRRDSVMGVPTNWTVIGSAIQLDFNDAYDPAFYAASLWAHPDLNEPVIWTADGKLLPKTWETIPVGDDENIYSTSPSPLGNEMPFAAGLRPVDLEERIVSIDATTLVQDIDHLVLPLPWPWWNVQDGLLDFDLIEDGRYREQSTFKCVPFQWGSAVYVAVYNLSPTSPTLEAFPIASRQLIVTRKV